MTAWYRATRAQGKVPFEIGWRYRDRLHCGIRQPLKGCSGSGVIARRRGRSSILVVLRALPRLMIAVQVH
jgi:hypothetical protein